MNDSVKTTDQYRGLHVRYMDLSTASLVFSVQYDSKEYQYTIVAIVSGKIQLAHEGIMIEASPLQICLLPKDCIIRPVNQESVKFWLLRFTEDFIDKITYSANKKAIQLLNDGLCQLNPDAETFKIIKKLLLLLFKFQNNGAEHSGLIRILAINLVLGCVAEISTETTVMVKVPVNRPEQIAYDFLRLAGYHAKEHHDVAYYAGLLCMTQGNLTKVVRKILLMPPKSLIEDILIRLAKERLEGSISPIYLIAEELNFKSSSAFINFFRNQTGTTPNEYRNRNTR